MNTVNGDIHWNFINVFTGKSFRFVNFLLGLFAFVLIVVGFVIGVIMGDVEYIRAVPIFMGVFIGMIATSAFFFEQDSSRFLDFYICVNYTACLFSSISSVSFFTVPSRISLWSGVNSDDLSEAKGLVILVSIILAIESMLLLGGVALARKRLGILISEQLPTTNDQTVETKYGSVSEIYEQTATYSDIPSITNTSSYRHKSKELREVIPKEPKYENPIFNSPGTRSSRQSPGTDTGDDEQALRSMYAQLYQKYSLVSNDRETDACNKSV